MILLVDKNSLLLSQSIGSVPLCVKRKETSHFHRGRSVDHQFVIHPSAPIWLISSLSVLLRAAPRCVAGQLDIGPSRSRVSGKGDSCHKSRLEFHHVTTEYMQ